MSESLSDPSAPPATVAPPDAAHALCQRAFQGISSLALSPLSIWATWYAGPTPNEDQNNYAVLSRSGDQGQTWQEQLIVDPDGAGPLRAFDPQLWVDPTGRLWWFWTQGVGHQGNTASVWTMTTQNPDAASPTWSAPRHIASGVMMDKPTILQNGDWALPVSTWRDFDNSAGLVASTDQGKTWLRRGGADVPRDARSYDEHIFVTQANGDIDVYVRTRYGIGRSVSKDRGCTWSPLLPTDIPHPDARFFIRRLQSGNLLLVKHGPLTERTGRSHLTAFLSTDCGVSWAGGLLLDERSKVSYPDGQQDQDGSIVITYDFERTGAREILMARFCEPDILRGDTTSPTVKLRQIISRF